MKSESSWTSRSWPAGNGDESVGVNAGLARHDNVAAALVLRHAINHGPPGRVGELRSAFQSQRFHAREPALSRRQGDRSAGRGREPAGTEVSAIGRRRTKPREAAARAR